MSKDLPVIALFREDLRLIDNQMLTRAMQNGSRLLCLYIHDEFQSLQRGNAQKWWLHHSLLSLQRDLNSRGGELNIRKGSSFEILKELCQQTNAKRVYWSRRYAPTQTSPDKILYKKLGHLGIEVKSCKGRLLIQPSEILTATSQPYRVFTPFWKNLRSMVEFERPLEGPSEINCLTLDDNLAVGDLGLLPKGFDWSIGFHDYWKPGEEHAQTQLNDFLANGANQYADYRDFPDRVSTSRLSPYLQMGEISPRYVLYKAYRFFIQNKINEKAFIKFYSELAWREFSYHLLYHFPEVLDQEFSLRFRDFPWIKQERNLSLWQKGMTGYPIVDAGMRELWQTGYMHNRVRMIVASFLTKHLLIDWREGMKWFWDTLVDADIASNTLSWQWVAGCGADAAPYFRIFNPILQAKKFDPNNEYTLKWVPELAKLPSHFVPEPWVAPANVLEGTKVKLGSTYPYPIVDHKSARDRALFAYASLKGNRK